MKKQNDSRYPYTYACDFIRGLAGYAKGGLREGTKLSRSDASSIRSGIAQALGIDDVDLARKLDDYYKAHQDEINEKMARDLIKSGRHHAD